MRFNLLLSCVVCMVFVGCKTDTQDVVVEPLTEEKQSKTIDQKEIESLKYNDYRLSDDASKIVGDWQKYQELNRQITYLKMADLSFFKSDITLITTFINDFRLEIPKALSTNEINSRITALETKMLKLNSLLLLDNIPKDEQVKAIKEVFVAFSNLNLQINKKLEFEANNILKPN